MIILLQDAIILYSRLQLNMIRGASDESSLVGQLFDIVCKDLDQSYTSIASGPWWVFLVPFVALHWRIYVSNS